MVRGIKWQISAKGKSGLIYTCNIQEKLYSDTPMIIDASARPFVLNALSNSDDPFNPILSSELVLTLDITDYTSALPDLTTRDDKKYLVSFYEGSNIVFQGYLLSDAVTLNFSTGRKILTLSCTDCIGMLQSIPYLLNYSSVTPTPEQGAVLVDINTTETLLEVLFNCLDKLELVLAVRLFQ